MKCLRCSGTRIVEGELDALSGIGLRQTPGIPTGKTPSMWFRLNGVAVVVNICIDCGHIEFQAANLSELHEKIKRLEVGFKD